MKKYFLQVLFFVLIISNAFSSEVIDFNKDWQFIKDGKLTQVNLPHTANIEPYHVNNQWQGICTYKKNLYAKPDWKDKNIFINFGAAMSKAEVFINDKLIYTNYGGYLPFEINLSPYLKISDKNEIKLVLDNRDNSDIPPGKTLKNLDFSWYGGLYRNVNLIIKNQVYITNPISANKQAGGGVYLTTENLLSNNANLKASINLKNTSSKKYDLILQGKILNDSAKEFAKSSREINISAKADTDYELSFNLANLNLWSPDYPNLYNLEISLLTKDGKILDFYKQNIGFREILAEAGNFEINGVQKYLRGTNRHQEYPYLGYALSDTAQKREAKLIKEAGFDLVRFAHYPMASSFVEACDEFGLAVMNPIPGWQFYKAGKFQKRTLENAKQMIRRDRNHASIFFWELSLNESYMPNRLIKQFAKIGKEELIDRDSILCGWIDHASYDMYIPARQHGNAPSYWDNWKKANKPLFTAEYGDWEYFARKDSNFNQVSIRDTVPDAKSSRHPRAAGEALLLQQARNFQEAHNQNKKGVSMIGDANWVFADYNRGYANDLCESGIVNIFRLPKFVYYFYQSQRSPKIINEKYSSGPMVYIASYWQENSALDIKIYSNCDEVELFLNGVSLGKQNPTICEISDALDHPPFIFNIDKFEAGKLKAVGYVDVLEVVKHEVQTPLEASKLEIDIADMDIPLVADGSDSVFVHAKILDNNSTLVVDSDLSVEFDVKGGAVIIGPKTVNAEAGIASILIQSNGQVEDIIISVKSRNLEQVDKVLVF